MQFRRRRAVSPIIATLLLIAIAVAAGIIVYVFVNSISGNLTQQGGQQVSEQLSMDAYTFPAASTTPSFVLRNVGSASVTITSIYYDGNLCQTTGVTCTGGGNNPAVTNVGSCSSNTALPTTCAAGQYTPVTLTLSAAPTSGTSHIIRIVTADGGTFTFSVLAGRSG